MSLNRKLKLKMLINCLHSILLQTANLTTVFQFEFLWRKERLESLSLYVAAGLDKRFHHLGSHIFFSLLLHSIEYFRNDVEWNTILRNSLFIEIRPYRNRRIWFIVLSFTNCFHNIFYNALSWKRERDKNLCTFIFPLKNFICLSWIINQAVSFSQNVLMFMFLFIYTMCV